MTPFSSFQPRIWSFIDIPLFFSIVKVTFLYSEVIMDRFIFILIKKKSCDLHYVLCSLCYMHLFRMEIQNLEKISKDCNSIEIQQL